MPMRSVYLILAALHIVSMVVTGILWTLIDLGYGSRLKSEYRDIRAVHFGSLYLVPWFLGLAYAFDRLKVPDWHQIFFPRGIGRPDLFLRGRVLVPAAAGARPLLLLDQGVADGAVDDRPRVLSRRALVDGHGPDPLCRRRIDRASTRVFLAILARAAVGAAVFAEEPNLPFDRLTTSRQSGRIRVRKAFEYVALRLSGLKDATAQQGL
jgi:hypothetical protein